MPGWCVGANRKPKPSSSIESAIRSGDSSSAKPSASSTSAEPDADETARLPCLATPAPAAAATRAAAVEMLIVAWPSPPVPAVSTRSVRFGATDTPRPRIASAKPAISSGVSPFRRRATRKPPIWAWVASPAMISSITARACGAVEVVAVEQPSERLLDHRDRKFRQRSGPSGVSTDSGWNCTPSTGSVAVADGHHLAVGGGRRHLEHLGHARSPRASGSGRPERAAAARRRCPRPSCVDRARLAVDELARLADLARRTPRRSPGGRGRRRASASSARAGGRSRRSRPTRPAAPGPARRRGATARSRSASSASIASFRRTTTSAPSSSKRCTRL